MPARHLCPNCACERASPQAQCSTCRYPNHVRPFEEPTPVLPKRNPYQFHLWTLMLWVTISAVAFSVIGRHGMKGFMERLDLIAAVYFTVIFPATSFYNWWKREGLGDSA